MKKRQLTYVRVLDETIELSRSGALLRFVLNRDEAGNLGRYSLAYINFALYSEDNGRVLGYDNSHGHHHRHYFGQVEPVDFISYEAIAEQFDCEWRALHEKAKKHHR